MAMELPKSWQRMRNEVPREEIVSGEEDTSQVDPWLQTLREVQLSSDKQAELAEMWKRIEIDEPKPWTKTEPGRTLLALGRLGGAGLAAFSPDVAGREALKGENITEQILGQKPRTLAPWERILAAVGIAGGAVAAVSKPLGAMKMLKSFLAAKKVLGTAGMWEPAEELTVKALSLPQKEWSRVSAVEFDPTLKTRRGIPGLFGLSYRGPGKGEITFDPVWADETTLKHEWMMGHARTWWPNPKPFEELVMKRIRGTSVDMDIALTQAEKLAKSAEQRKKIYWWFDPAEELARRGQKIPWGPGAEEAFTRELRGAAEYQQAAAEFLKTKGGAGLFSPWERERLQNLLTPGREARVPLASPGSIRQGGGKPGVWTGVGPGKPAELIEAGKRLPMKEVFFKRVPEGLAEIDTVELEEGSRLVTRVIAPKGARGQGHGEELMKELTGEADRTGTRLMLEINPYGDLSREQLEKWYGKHGFEPMTGKFEGFFERKPLKEKTAELLEPWVKVPQRGGQRQWDLLEILKERNLQERLPELSKEELMRLLGKEQ